MTVEDDVDEGQREDVIDESMEYICGIDGGTLQ